MWIYFLSSSSSSFQLRCRFKIFYTHILKDLMRYIKNKFFYCPSKHLLMNSVYVRMLEHGISFLFLCFVHCFLSLYSIYLFMYMYVSSSLMFVFLFFCRSRMIEKEICKFRFSFFSCVCVYVCTDWKIWKGQQSIFYCV
jgi:hypothetical protein